MIFVSAPKDGRLLPYPDISGFFRDFLAHFSGTDTLKSHLQPHEQRSDGQRVRLQKRLYDVHSNRTQSSVLPTPLPGGVSSCLPLLSNDELAILLKSQPAGARSLGRLGTPLFSQAVIIDGDWHRVGLTWDGLNKTLFVDCIEVAKGT